MKKKKKSTILHNVPHCEQFPSDFSVHHIYSNTINYRSGVRRHVQVHHIMSGTDEKLTRIINNRYAACIILSKFRYPM
jgi:hypothetical protein